MLTAERVFDEILGMPLYEREKLFLFIARRGFISSPPATPRRNLTRFCGAWKDERSADDIIEEIYTDRQRNTRSDQVLAIELLRNNQRMF